jgi:anti-anti-sigma regulatory factor
VHRTGHILLLHHSDGERMRYVADWFGAGAVNEDKLLYVEVAGWGVDTLTAALGSRGFQVDRALSDKRLEFVTLEDLLDLDVSGGLVDRALNDDGYPGVRLAVRCDAVATRLDHRDHVDLEHRLARLCHDSHVSALCQYDGRTTQGRDLALALDLHPDWVYESDLSMLRRDHVIQVEGLLDSLDGDVLRRSLTRMTRELSIDHVLALDLRNVEAITPAACHALLEGTRTYRTRGGQVRCGPPADEPARVLLGLLIPDDDNFTVG